MENIMYFPETISVESAGNGFDWGALIVIAVICVISRAAVQMSVFTHNQAKTSPLWTDTYLLFPDIIKSIL